LEPVRRASPVAVVLIPVILLTATAVALVCAFGALPVGVAGDAAQRATGEPLAAVLATDCGVDVDDQWALAHILLSRELDLRAIITTHASSIHYSSATSARTAAAVVEHVLPAKASAIPIVAGSDVPLADAATPRANAGATLLRDLSRNFSRATRLIVLSIGASTDVASAIIEDPSIADRVTVVAMGFNDWPTGGDEFNIRNDPLAWRAILSSRVPLVVGSGTAAKRSLRLTRADAARLMRPHGPTGDYLYRLFDDWLTRNPEVTAKMVSPGAWVIWDEIVVAYALGLARGDQVERPELQPDFFFAHPKTPDRITWINRVESDRLWQDFARKIDARDAALSRSH
jgi:inosine-uridine nucleoside N-ribohydrolase